MPNPKPRLCSRCRRPTANKAGLCTACLNGSAPAAGEPWRRVMAAGYGGGFEGLPRTARVSRRSRQFCGGGTRRLARPADY